MSDINGNGSTTLDRLRTELVALPWIDPSVRGFLLELAETELLDWHIDLLLTDFIPFQTRQWEFEVACDSTRPDIPTVELSPALTAFLTPPDSADDLIQRMGVITTSETIRSSDKRRLIINLEVYMFISGMLSESDSAAIRTKLTSSLATWLNERSLYSETLEVASQRLGLPSSFLASHQLSDIRNAVSHWKATDVFTSWNSLADFTVAAVHEKKPNAALSIAFAAFDLDVTRAIDGNEFGVAARQFVSNAILDAQSQPHDGPDLTLLSCDPTCRMAIAVHEALTQIGIPKLAAANTSAFLELVSGETLSLRRLEEVVDALHIETLDGLLHACWSVLTLNRDQNACVTLLRIEVKSAASKTAIHDWWKLPHAVTRTLLWVSNANSPMAFVDSRFMREAMSKSCDDERCLGVILNATPSGVPDLIVARWLWSLFDETSNAVDDEEKGSRLLLVSEINRPTDRAVCDPDYRHGSVNILTSAARTVAWFQNARMWFNSDRLDAFSSLNLGGILFAPASHETDSMLPALFERLPGFQRQWQASQLMWWSLRGETEHACCLSGELLGINDIRSVPVTLIADRMMALSRSEPQLPLMSLAMHVSQLLVALDFDRWNVRDDVPERVCEFWERLLGVNAISTASLESDVVRGDHPFADVGPYAVHHLLLVAEGHRKVSTESHAPQILRARSRGREQELLERAAALSRAVLRRSIRNAAWSLRWHCCLQAHVAASKLTSARDLVKSELANLDWLAPDTDFSPLSARISLAAECLTLALLHSDVEFATRLKSGLVDLLRQRFETWDNIGDRKSVHSWTEDVRHLVARSSASLAVMSLGERTNLYREWLSLDAEFSTRWLLDEARQFASLQSVLLDGPIPTRDVGEALSPPPLQKSRGFQEREENKRNCPQIDRTVGEHSGSMPVESERNGRNSRIGQNVVRFGERGLDVDFLASELSERDRLLKIGFTLDGAVTWGLFRTTGSRVELVAYGVGGATGNIAEALKEELRLCDEACEKNGYLAEYCDKRVANAIAKWSRVLPLSEIARHLSVDDDLVLMLDGTLQSLPLAWLKVDPKRHLFQVVRTIRTILSPLAMASVKPLEQEPIQSHQDLLTISGISEDSSQKAIIHPAVHDLISGQHTLAESSGSQWAGAWFTPPGSHDVLARGLEATAKAGGRIALLTIVGHGDLGVVELRSDRPEFDSEFWHGSHVYRFSGNPSNPTRAEMAKGCDLSLVDMLIQISCKVGRIQQRGLSDVEGFTVNLAVASARSVVAAKWPILARNSVDFANNLAEEYLRLRDEAEDQGQSLLEACVRARAMANVRRQWVESRTEGDITGLHMIAAFDLFGFG